MHDLSRWNRRIAHSTRHVISKTLGCLPEGGTLIDVGANTGVVSVAAIKFRNARVYAFEPVPEYCKFCREATGDRATVEESALGAEKGHATLWCHTGNLGWNTLISEWAGENMQPVEVNIIKFDEYADIHNIDRIDVIKIDVEGYEYAVLAGMHKFLLKFHPVILMEVGGGTQHPYRGKEVEQVEWLFANGYQRINYDYDRSIDLVFMPETKV